jgi:hypothetical protein
MKTMDEWRVILAPVTRTDYRLMFFEIGILKRENGEPKPQPTLLHKWRVKDEMMTLGWDVCDGVLSQTESKI